MIRRRAAEPRDIAAKKVWATLPQELAAHSDELATKIKAGSRTLPMRPGLGKQGLKVVMEGLHVARKEALLTLQQEVSSESGGEDDAVAAFDRQPAIRLVGQRDPTCPGVHLCLLTPPLHRKHPMPTSRR